MHRKRVTCELHDSYFRLMTIKHAIPRTAEVTHPDGQSWGDIEWAIELLYNSVKTGSQWVWRPVSLETRWWQEAVEKARTQQSGPPMPQVEQHQENGKETLMAIRVGVNMLQFCSVPNSLSHTNLSNKMRGIFFKEVFARLYSLRQYVFCMYMYIYAYLLCDYTTQEAKNILSCTVY